MQIIKDPGLKWLWTYNQKWTQAEAALLGGWGDSRGWGSLPLPARNMALGEVTHKDDVLITNSVPVESLTRALNFMC